MTFQNVYLSGRAAACGSGVLSRATEDSSPHAPTRSATEGRAAVHCHNRSRPRQFNLPKPRKGHRPEQSQQRRVSDITYVSLPTWFIDVAINRSSVLRKKHVHGGGFLMARSLLGHYASSCSVPIPEGDEATMRIFDELDRKMIAVLRKDARVPISKLALILGISRTTAQTRLDRLFDSGTLLGFSVRVREDHDAGAIRAVMMVQVSGHSSKTIIRRLQELPELQALHTTNGAWDFIVEIRASGLSDFDRLLHDVRRIEGISNTETSIILSSL